MRRKTIYIYDRPDWPTFRWDARALECLLGAVRHRQGKLLGRMTSLGFEVAREANLQNLTEEAVKTSEIEGEILTRRDVRSSLARRLGMDGAGTGRPDQRAEAIAAVVLDASQNFSKPLTADRLFQWHRTLFARGEHGFSPIRVGAWRDDKMGPMRVVSGRYGHETIHFQAPAAGRVPGEMTRFLSWFEAPPETIDPLLKAAVAHIWFVTIHPFDDGNGRIGRAIADLSLARADGIGQRFFSLSSRLRAERATYYSTLEATQKGDLDVTACLNWFLGEVDGALAAAETALAETIRRTSFWAQANTLALNERQKMMLARLLDGFVGKLTTSKWASMAKCSQDTALRDIDGLIQLGLMTKEAPGGRSTSYALIR